MKNDKLQIDTNCQLMYSKKSQSLEELRPKVNLPPIKKPIRIRSYLLMVSVEPETEVLYTSKGWPAGPCTTFPAVSKMEL